MVKDMTKGKPLGLIIMFCLPLMLGNLFQQIYSMADALIVGQFLGTDAFGGVGSTGALFFLVVGFAGGLCSGFGISLSQAFGAGDYSKMRRLTANSVYLCIIFTVIITALTMTFCRQLLVLTKTPAELIDYAYSYVIWIFAGIGTVILYNMCAAVCRALGDSKTPLKFLIISCLVNVSLDYLFIGVFKMGTEGAGIATIIAQLISGLLCLRYIKNNYSVMKFEEGEWAIDTSLWGGLIGVALPMALQFSITAVGSVLLQTAVNSLGKTAVNAIVAAYKVQAIAILPMETIGVTLATFCGQNLGAGKYARILKGIRTGTVISMIYCVTMTFIMYFTGTALSRIFISGADSETLSLITRFMRVTAPWYFILGILFIFRNVLQGLRYSIPPMLGGVIELFARAYVAFVLIKSSGYNAVCWSGPIAWIAAGVFVTIAFFLKIKSIKSACGHATRIKKPCAIINSKPIECNATAE